MYSLTWSIDLIAASAQTGRNKIYRYVVPLTYHIYNRVMMRWWADETPILYQRDSRKQHSTTTIRIPALTAAKSRQLVRHVSGGMTGARETIGDGASGQELIRRACYWVSYADWYCWQSVKDPPAHNAPGVRPRNRHQTNWRYILEIQNIATHTIVHNSYLSNI